MEVDPLIRWLGRPHEEPLKALTCLPFVRGQKLAQILERLDKAELDGLVVVNRDMRKEVREWTVSLTEKGREVVRAANAP